MNRSSEIYPGGVDYNKSERIPENRLYQITVKGVEIIASRIYTREELAERYLKMKIDQGKTELDNYSTHLAVEESMSKVLGENYNPESLEQQIKEAAMELEKIREEKKQNPQEAGNQYFFVPDHPVYELYLPKAKATFGFNDPKVMDYFFARAMILAHQGSNADVVAEKLRKETFKFNNKMI